MYESLGQFIREEGLSIFGKGHNESLWVAGNDFFIDLCGITWLCSFCDNL